MIEKSETELARSEEGFSRADSFGALRGRKRMAASTSGYVAQPLIILHG